MFGIRAAFTAVLLLSLTGCRTTRGHADLLPLPPNTVTVYNDSPYSGDVLISGRLLGELKAGKVLPHQQLLTSTGNAVDVEFWAYDKAGNVTGRASRKFPVSIYGVGEGYEWHVEELLLLQDIVKR